MKEWTFLHIILWLTSGLPQPHTAAMPTHVECTPEIAQQVWNHYVSELPDGDATLNYAWSCDYAKEPAPDTDAAPELPPGHPDISKPKAKGDEA